MVEYPVLSMNYAYNGREIFAIVSFLQMDNTIGIFEIPIISSNWKKVTYSESSPSTIRMREVTPSWLFNPSGLIFDSLVMNKADLSSVPQQRISLNSK